MGDNQQQQPLYRILMNVKSYNSRHREGKYQPEENFDEYVIGNLETALNLYEKALNKLKMYQHSSSCSGSCSLFIPHVFENGTLATWPDKDNYIKRVQLNDCELINHEAVKKLTENENGT